MNGFLFDLRDAVRGLRRDRALTLTAIVTLVIALALNAFVFTVREAMVSRGLPLAERSDRLRYIGMRKPDRPCCPGPVKYADFEAWRAESRAFAGLAFGHRHEPITFRARNDRLIDMTVSRHTTNTFGLLGVQPILGRDFTNADAIPGAPAVAIISHEFWARRLNKRTDVIGLPVVINGTPASIVGVLPERFAIVYPQEIYMPLARPTAAEEGEVIGRLRDGATQEEARAELDAVTRRLPLPDPGTTRGTASVATYTQAHISPDAPRIYGSLWAGAWFVLLIACANLTNLMLARTNGRWREFSTRIALGEGVTRAARRMLFESVVLAAVAAVPAWWTVKWTVRTWAEATASRYLVLDYSVTAGTLGYLISITLASAILIALLPIARVLQVGTDQTLKGHVRGATSGRQSRRLAAALVAGQMALAIVLLLGAGVLVRSFQNIVGADTGVRNAEQITAGLVGLPSDKYPTPESRARFFERLATHLRTIGGTQDAAIASTLPTRYGRRREIEIDDRPARIGAADATQQVTVSPDYFRTMGRSMIAGRDFTSNELATTPVVIVNESFAAEYWPGDQAVGKRLRLVDGGAAGPWRTVVGVAANVMQADPLRQSFKPVIYVPFNQQPAARAFVFVRANAPTSQITHTVRAEVHTLDSDVITEDFASLDAALAFDRDWMDLEHADLGKHAAIAPVFGVAALVLAAVGLVAVIAHSVSQRTKEIGVRMAVGASGHAIARMIVREGMRPVAIGTVAGLIAAAGGNRLLQSQLVGVSPFDPLIMATGPLVLLAVALAGCRVPARRAVRIDPVVALRQE